MRSRRQQAVRPLLRSARIESVKLLDSSPEASGITADFIQRYQPVKPIKRSVFQSFGHHRTGKLLELHYQSPRL
jgi:hypothetical protein